ncbi:hypothetical protein HanIR_Chr17g0899451 [Helianthus annuus]|nr:hypothetical protein HanIR_Chr17g0899451 [Helianthus annuus]
MYTCIINYLIPFKPAPTPSQAGRTNRVWVQAKIHGMARRWPIPTEVFRRVGRLPMFKFPSSACGVASSK